MVEKLQNALVQFVQNMSAQIGVKPEVVWAVMAALALLVLLLVFLFFRSLYLRCFGKKVIEEALAEEIEEVGEAPKAPATNDGKTKIVTVEKVKYHTVITTQYGDLVLKTTSPMTKEEIRRARLAYEAGFIAGAKAQKAKAKKPGKE